MTPPARHLALTADPHDREALRRSDESWLDRVWADPASRVLVVSGTRVRPAAGHVPWVAAPEAPDGLRVWLGRRHETAYLAVITGPELAAAQPQEWLPLRGLLPLLDREATGAAPLLLHALGLAEWHWATRFCPRCAGTLFPRAAGHELSCADCGRTQFPRTDPAVIMLITHGAPGSPEERCLLGRQPVWPERRFSTLAGFCEPGESLEDAVRREVAEEVGLPVGEVDYVGNQPWPLPASLMVGFFGRALRDDVVVDQDEIAEARWFTRSELDADAHAGTVVLPGAVSISRFLIEQWHGGALPGQW